MTRYRSRCSAPSMRRRHSTILQVDAHLDFRDEVAGIRDGYSSPMRRAAEMDHVARIVQVGLRGSAARGPMTLPPRARPATCSSLPASFESAESPGCSSSSRAMRRCSWPSTATGSTPRSSPRSAASHRAGSATRRRRTSSRGAAARCRIAGAAFTELVPDRDINERSALVVVRLVTRLLAAMARRSSPTG